MKYLKLVLCILLSFGFIISLCSCSIEGVLNASDETTQYNNTKEKVVSNAYHKESESTTFIPTTPVVQDDFDVLYQSPCYDTMNIDILRLASLCISYDFSQLGYDVYSGYAVVGEKLVPGIIYTKNEINCIDDNGRIIFSCGFVQIEERGIGTKSIELSNISNGVAAVTENGDVYIVSFVEYINAYSGIFESVYFCYEQTDDFYIEVGIGCDDTEEYNENIDLFDFDNDKYLYKADLSYNSISACGVFCDEQRAYSQARKAIEEVLSLQEENLFSTSTSTMVIFTGEVINELMLNGQSEAINGYLTQELNKLDLAANQYLVVTTSGVTIKTDDTANQAKMRIAQGAVNTLTSLIMTAGVVLVCVATCGAGAPVAVVTLVAITASGAISYSISNAVEGISDIVHGIKGDVTTEAVNPIRSVFQKATGNEELGTILYHVWGVSNAVVLSLINPVTAVANKAIEEGTSVVWAVSRAVAVKVAEIAIVAVGSYYAGQGMDYLVTQITESEIAGYVSGSVTSIAAAFALGMGAEALDQKYNISGIYPSSKTEAANSLKKTAVQGENETISKAEVNSARSKASKLAKNKQVIEDIVNDQNMHGLRKDNVYDRQIIDFIKQNGRFPSYNAGDGIQCEFAHGVDVSKTLRAYENGLITKSEALSIISNPENGALTSHYNHFHVYHGGSWFNETNYELLIINNPESAETITNILSMVK